MALFNFGKKKEEKKVSSCCCGSVETNVEENSCCSPVKVEENSSCCSNNRIKVLGAGCKNCHDLFDATKIAAKNMGLCVDVEYVTDMEKIMEYGVMSMPSLVVNEKVVSMGQVLKAADVEKLLRKVGF